MEEMSLEKPLQMTTLQKSINNQVILNALDQIIKLNSYSPNKVQNRCLSSQLLLKIIIYLIIREGNNIAEITKLQYQIRKTFSLLSSEPKANYDPKRLQRNFLFQILLISQIIERIGSMLQIYDLRQMNPETIFIIIIFLSTDKLVSPLCFKLVQQQLQMKHLPFEIQRLKQPAKVQSNLKELTDRTEAQSFKEEVRSIIHPKIEQKQRIKPSHSVGLMISKFKNKENMSHYSMNKALRLSKLSSEPFFSRSRSRKCFSQSSTASSKLDLLALKKCQKKYTWSKCEIVKTNYVPFCTIKTSTPKKNKLVINSCLKFKKIKQKTIQFHERHHELILEI